MGTKLYVGNLSYNTTSEELSSMFAGFGSVRSAQVIEDRMTGRSKGFGFRGGGGRPGGGGGYGGDRRGGGGGRSPRSSY